MSIKAMTWAWKQSIPPAEKLVLLALADYADADWIAWPSLRVITEKTGLHSSNVKRGLNKLIERNLIRRERRHDDLGDYASTCYYLGVGAQRANPLAHTAPTVGAPRAKGRRTARQVEEPSSEPSLEPEDHPPTPLDDKLTPEDLQEGWNDICVKAGLSRVAELSQSRRTKAIQRIKEHPNADWWGTAMTRIAHSRFCCGHVPGKNGAKPWKASFDWLINNDVNAVKAYEGKYNDA